METTIAKAQFVPLKDGQIQKGEAIPVQFNPASLAVTSKADGSEQGDFALSLTVDLLFDTTRSAQADRDVQQHARQLYALMGPRQTADANKLYHRPPVAFVWGNFLFEGRITSFSETLEYFSADGTPLRSKVKVSLEGDATHWRTARRG